MSPISAAIVLAVASMSLSRSGSWASTRYRYLHTEEVLLGVPTRWLGTRALKCAGIENFRWHDLRHARAAWHRQAGTPTHELQRLGGWRFSVMVERCAHLVPDHLTKANLCRVWAPC